MTQGTRSGRYRGREVSLVRTYTEQKGQVPGVWGRGRPWHWGGDLWLPEATGHTHRTAQWTHVARISGQGADTPVLDEDRQDV